MATKGRHREPLLERVGGFNLVLQRESSSPCNGRQKAQNLPPIHQTHPATCPPLSPVSQVVLERERLKEWLWKQTMKWMDRS